MRHLNLVLVCVLGLFLSVPAATGAAGDDPVTKSLQDEAKAGPYCSPGGCPGNSGGNSGG